MMRFFRQRSTEVALPPIVILQSDDWGRVGVRDREGWEQLRAAGVALGEKPYDYYSLETADDLAAIRAVLNRHRDSSGRAPCLVMNFCVANLDFPKILDSDFQSLYLCPLAEGLPGNWNRPGLLDEYAQGISDGVFYPALHGTTHACPVAFERRLKEDSSRGELLRTLLRAQTPYIYWRMPWIGFEYWDRDSHDQFLRAEDQLKLVQEAVDGFKELFGVDPRSACAPGYRANDDTREAWKACGIRVAQNGTAGLVGPRMDESGLLHTYRTVEIEPALDPARYTVSHCVEQAVRCFKRGIPAIVSLHSINFHSTLRDFRSATLRVLDEFLAALEQRYTDLLYLHDLDLYELIADQSANRKDLAPIEPVASAAGRGAV